MDCKTNWAPSVDTVFEANITFGKFWALCFFGLMVGSRGLSMESKDVAYNAVAARDKFIFVCGENFPPS